MIGSRSNLPNMTGRGFGRTILGASRSPVIRLGLRGRRAYSFAAEQPGQPKPHIVIGRTGRALAALALPAAPGHARTTAGSETFGVRAPRGLLFFALVNSVQEPTSRLTKCFRSVFVNLRHGDHHDRRKRQSVVRA